MILKGWVNHLEPYIEAAVKDGRLMVIYRERDKTEYLYGKVLNPHTGIIVEFQ